MGCLYCSESEFNWHCFKLPNLEGRPTGPATCSHSHVRFDRVSWSVLLLNQLFYSLSLRVVQFKVNIHFCPCWSENLTLLFSVILPQNLWCFPSAAICAAVLESTESKWPREQPWWFSAAASDQLTAFKVSSVGVKSPNIILPNHKVRLPLISNRAAWLCFLFDYSAGWTPLLC